MGVEKEVITAAPAGAKKPQTGQTVTVHCTGYGKHRDLTQKFWSTKDPGQVHYSKRRYFRQACHPPVLIKIVVLLYLVVVKDIMLRCRTTLSSGERSWFPTWGILPDSTLVFEIEVLSID
ncbi:unnamed protein product [Ascophyllum nodosum]